jgi:hypothetical protein
MQLPAIGKPKLAAIPPRTSGGRLRRCCCDERPPPALQQRATYRPRGSLGRGWPASRATTRRCLRAWHAAARPASGWRTRPAQRTRSAPPSAAAPPNPTASRSCASAAPPQKCHNPFSPAGPGARCQPRRCAAIPASNSDAMRTPRSAVTFAASLWMPHPTFQTATSAISDASCGGTCDRCTTGARTHASALDTWQAARARESAASATSAWRRFSCKTRATATAQICAHLDERHRVRRLAAPERGPPLDVCGAARQRWCAQRQRYEAEEQRAPTRRKKNAPKPTTSQSLK